MCSYDMVEQQMKQRECSGQEAVANSGVRREQWRVVRQVLVETRALIPNMTLILRLLQ